MKDRVVWLARYEGFFRHICRGIRNGDEACMKQSAQFYAAMIPRNAIVVPMPGHEGMAKQMLFIAYEIGKLRDDIMIRDVLKSQPHTSNHDQKMCGRVPLPIRMECNCDNPFANKPIVVIDNVVVSGVTAQAALDALPSAIVFCLCKDMWR